MTELTPSMMARNVLQHERKYALVQEIHKHESGYPYLRQVLALYHIEKSGEWKEADTTELLVE